MSYDLEAVPATFSVASSRYSILVNLLLSMRRFDTGFCHLAQVLDSVFVTPGPWIPENVGSVLLLLGQATTRDYLLHLAVRPGSCHNCFRNLATAITGVAVMTARFRRPFDNVFQLIEDVVEVVEGPRLEPIPCSQQSGGCLERS